MFRYRNAAEVQGSSWLWLSTMVGTLAELSTPAVPSFRNLRANPVRISEHSAQAFKVALLQAEEVAIRTINEHIATMPA